MHYLAIFTLVFLPVCAIASGIYANDFTPLPPIDYSVPYTSTERGEMHRIREELEQMRRDAEYRAMREQMDRHAQELREYLQEEPR